MTSSFLAIERELNFLRGALRGVSPGAGRGLYGGLRAEALLGLIEAEQPLASAAPSAPAYAEVLDGLSLCVAAWYDYDRRRCRFREQRSGDDKRALLAAKAACEGGIFMGLSAASKPPGPLLGLLGPLYRGWCQRAVAVPGTSPPAVDAPLWLAGRVGEADGAAWRGLLSELRGAVIASRGLLDDDYRNALRLTLDRLHSTWLKMQRGREVLGSEIYFSHADVLITLLGRLWLAAAWLRLAAAARQVLLTAAENNLSADELNFHRGKLRACQYVYRWQLPQAEAQLSLLASLDSLCYDTDPAWL